MNLLLDTNSLVWASDERRKGSLGKQARRLIENSQRVYMSPISIAELEIKFITGKFKKMPDVEAAVASGLIILDFKTEHAKGISNFPSLIRHDPFDRMILAQAYAEQLILLSADETLLKLGLDYVVNARE